MKKFVFGAILAALSTFALVSCQPVTTYSQSYAYEIELSRYVYYVDSEVAQIQAELYDAVGYNPVNRTLTINYINKDEEMKAKCKAIQDKYAKLDVQTTYLEFTLTSIFDDTTPGTERKRTTIGTYTFGAALHEPWVAYIYQSNHDEVNAAMKAKKEEKGEEAVKESMKTLSAVENGFKNRFAKFHPYPDTESNTKAVKSICDSIFNANADKKTFMPFEYYVSKVDVISLDKTELWRKTFEANME